MSDQTITLTCRHCDQSWERPRQRGRRPHLCPDCKDAGVRTDLLKQEAPAADEPARGLADRLANDFAARFPAPPQEAGDLDPQLVAALLSDPHTPVALIRASQGRQAIAGHLTAWRSWEAFARYHDTPARDGVDPRAVAAYVIARTEAGVGHGSIRKTLSAISLAEHGTTSVTASTVLGLAVLTDLWDDGRYDPAVRQAPVLTVGEIVAVALAAGSRPRRGRDEGLDRLLAARDLLVTVVTYNGALRPGEWSWVDLEHIGPAADGRGGVELVLPSTKTGQWQRHVVPVLDGLPKPADLLETYLSLRGRDAGPLLVDQHGEHGRVSAQAVSYLLRAAAAAAGIRHFSAYSLRRSRATHAFLDGAKARELRRLLRHRSKGVHTRYIEPQWALWDLEEARTRYLTVHVPELDPVSIDDLTTGAQRRTRASAYAFAGGVTIDALLASEDVDPDAIPPACLVGLAASTLAQGQRRYEQIAGWAKEHGVDLDADPDGLSEWVMHHVDQDDANPRTIRAALDAYDIGWSLTHDADRRGQAPGLADAIDVADGAVRLYGKPAKTKSRVAVNDDLEPLLSGVPAPSATWASAVISAALKGSGAVRAGLVGVAEGAAVLEVDGKQVRLDPGPGGLVCPVVAVETLEAAGISEVELQPTGWEAVFAAGMDRTDAMWKDVAVLLIAGSGARTSDLARARVVGVDAQPGGIAIWLEARKGRRGKDQVRPEFLWVPYQVAGFDVGAALDEWVAWWPAPDGPLLPDLNRPVAELVAGGGGLARVPTSRLRSVMVDRIKDATDAGAIAPGLTPMGWRYAFPERLRRDGVPMDAIREAMGHASEDTTAGYMRMAEGPFAVDREDELWREHLADLQQHGEVLA